MAGSVSPDRENDLLECPYPIARCSDGGALPYVEIKRQVSELRDRYDFMIAGGGTAGLTVADRLTQAFPKSRFTHLIVSACYALR